MTDNRTTELVSRREATTLLEEFLCGYQNILLTRGIDASEAVCKQNELIGEYAERIEQAIAATLGSEINGNTSDGYHTFNELYHHRAVLFSVIVRDHRELAWKARKHHDGTMYDGMFIVGIETPKGQATYHYDFDPYWEMFDCEEREFAPECDGHTPDDAIARIAELGSGTCHMSFIDEYETASGEEEYLCECSECGYRRWEHAHDLPLFCSKCGRKVN